MKKVLFLFFPLLLAGCYTPTQVFRFEPSEKEQVYNGHGHVYSYENIDSIIVSLEFIGHFNNEFIFDLTIDNRSNDTFEFNPSEIYLVRYSSDTSLAEEKIYHPINPGTFTDSIHKEMAKQEKRVDRSAIFSILLAAAYLTTEIVAATSDNISFETMEAVRVGHEISQIALDQSRVNAFYTIDELYFTEDYWKHCVMKKSVVEADTFYAGKIHFKTDFSPKYNIYIPANNHIFRFSFDGVSELK